MPVILQSSQRFSTNRQFSQSSLPTPQISHGCHVTPKLSWHWFTWISPPCKILHSQSVEQAVRTISTSGKKKKKKICKSSKIVISRLSNAETSLKSSGRKKKKKRKWNPVTRIIWQDDSSLVKGIGTAVFSGFPAEYYCLCFISVVVVLSHFEPSNCQSWAPFSLQRRSYHSVSKQQSTLNN